MKLLQSLVVAVAILCAMPAVAYEVIWNKPPGYNIRSLYLSTEDVPPFGDTREAEDALTQAIDEIMKYSSWHSAKLTYLGTRDECIEGEEKVIPVCWQGVNTYRPVVYSSRHGYGYGDDGLPMTFHEFWSMIALNLNTSFLPKLLDEHPEQLCVAFLQQLLSVLGLGNEYDVPSITNERVDHFSCKLTPDDVEGLAFVHPPSGETNLHCGWSAWRGTLRIPFIGYNNKWYSAETEWTKGTGRWKVTSAKKLNALPYPGCEDILTFDSDLTVHSVPVRNNEGSLPWQGAVYEITFTLDVKDLSIDVISNDLVTNNGCGVGVECPDD